MKRFKLTTDWHPKLPNNLPTNPFYSNSFEEMLQYIAYWEWMAPEYVIKNTPADKTATWRVSYSFEWELKDLKRERYARRNRVNSEIEGNWESNKLQFHEIVKERSYAIFLEKYRTISRTKETTIDVSDREQQKSSVIFS